LTAKALDSAGNARFSAPILIWVYDPANPFNGYVPGGVAPSTSYSYDAAGRLIGTGAPEGFTLDDEGNLNNSQ
jgi:hypothetical protein